MVSFGLTQRRVSYCDVGLHLVCFMLVLDEVLAEVLADTAGQCTSLAALAAYGDWIRG